jgi:hypothetical protein
MALTLTTISSAVTVADTSIVVASATSISAGNRIVIDQEVMTVAKGYASGTTIPVLRGQDGTATAAHASSAAVMQGIGAADFAAVPPTQFTAMQPSNAVFIPYDVTATGATGSTATNIGPGPGLIAATGVSGTGINLLATAAVPGTFYTFKNMGTGVLKIYSVGATINGTTGTTAVSITATGNLGANIMCARAGAWVITPTPT